MCYIFSHWRPYTCCAVFIIRVLVDFFFFNLFKYSQVVKDVVSNYALVLYWLRLEKLFGNISVSCMLKSIKHKYWNIIYACYCLFRLGCAGCFWLCCVQKCEPAFYLWSGDLCLEFTQMNSDRTIRLEVTLCGWRDGKTPRTRQLKDRQTCSLCSSGLSQEGTVRALCPSCVHTHAYCLILSRLEMNIPRLHTGIINHSTDFPPLSLWGPPHHCDLVCIEAGCGSQHQGG